MTGSSSGGRPEHVPVILNPSARNGAVLERVATLRSSLAAHGVAAGVVESTSEQHATELANGFANEGHPVVVSLGGDGMVRAVAAGLVGTDAALGIVAGGRGNDFIGKLGIPKNIGEAAAIIASGDDRTIDVLDLDGRICVGNVSAGMDAAVQHYADTARRIKGHWVYTYGLVRALLQPRRIDLALTIDGERVEFRGYSAGFANSGRYGGGLKLSPSARLDDGLIDVVLLRDVFLPKLGAQLVPFNLGKHDRHPDIDFRHATEVRIETPAGSDPMQLFADGDAVATTPATLRVRPSVLKVRVPR
ncbi:diacylglycerol/lipid kinase family protein [Flexivirga sp. B27]